MAENPKNQTRTFIVIIVGIVAGLAVNAFGWMIFLINPLGYFIKAWEARDLFFPELGYIIMLLVSGPAVYRLFRMYLPGSLTNKTAPLQNEINQALQRAQAEPGKAKPAWDLARVKLELYFDRNLSQINYIFWLSVIVMTVGFGLIMYGISQSLIVGQPGPGTENAVQTNSINPAMIGTLAGIITEFIGATFLFIYRSTIQQALKYTSTLERINSVGMAMQILDSISQESTTLRDTTKAEIVKMVLSQAASQYQVTEDEK